MALTFHWISGSPFAWRAMLALEYKGLKYESHRMDLSKGEHKAAEYLAVNPRGKVPALQDGDFTVYESLAIIVYLERINPEQNLLGENATETAVIWQRICELDNYMAPAIMGIVRPILFGPDEPELAGIAEFVTDTHQELKLLEQRLSESTYLAGDRVTAADLVFVPMLEYLIRASGKQTVSADNFGFMPLDSQYPNIAAWSTRMQVMQGYDQAYPPHWRE